MTITELQTNLQKLKVEFTKLPFNLEESKQLNKQLEEKLSLPDVYNDIEKYKEVFGKQRFLSKKINLYEGILFNLELIEDIVKNMNESEYDAAEEWLLETQTNIEELKTLLLLRGKYDANNCIITIHAGAGGTEACDWTDIVYRMYLMYCQKMKFTTSELDKLPGDGAGIKSVTFKVEGENAYGYLKAEKGIHRLVRISPFDANKRRHTSFTSVEVIPEFSSTNDGKDIIVRDDEIEVSTFRSSGAGGQHVNKTESAIRILHKPTGIIVKCQEERSQTQNKEKALEKLKQLLLIDREEKQLEEISQLRGTIKKIEWGSQIRSYVFCPYTLVKDHRTGYENSDVQKIIDGNIQEFINQYLASLTQ
jgi:peptide chain release factor 2